MWEKREPVDEFIRRKNEAVAIYEDDRAPLDHDAFVAEYMHTLKICRPEMHRRLVRRLAVVGMGESRQGFISILRTQVQLDFLARTPSDDSYW